MIRILQVVTNMDRGGLETMIMNYYRILNRNKYQFDFLTHRNTVADYDNEIKSMGGKIYHLPVLNPFGFQYRHSLSSFFLLHSEYKIIHVHLDCMSSIVLKEAQKKGVRVRIAHCHSSNQDINLKYLLKILYKQFIPKYATKLLSCGYLAGKWMYGNNKFELFKNAINTCQFRYDSQKEQMARELLNIVKDEFVIGLIANFSPAKNHIRLIEIFRQLREIKKAKLLLIGSGKLENSIKSRVNQSGLNDDVIFLGKRSDIARIIHAIDVFVMPSLHEGTPVSLIEAQAAGIPCVISSLVPDDCMITDRIRMLDLKEKNDIWAQEILSLSSLGKKDTSEEIRKAGYDIFDNINRLMEYYNE
ncbi:MAG: glycosyltransferase family 1 protein [Clostridia bacterium]|nr:glycosyltransferase family 1 protein [Clostridia bacterium]